MAAYATPEGTSAFAQRMSGRVAPGHFRSALGLQVASIGLGTYLGEPDSATDVAYQNAVAAALAQGCNVIDTAINYRFQRSERAIGAALAHAFAAGTAHREEVIVATKAGFIPFDAVPPRDPSRWFYDTFVATGIATADDVVAGCHCLAPAYVQHQVTTSLRNLRLQCIDIHYLHNPETQLKEVSRDTVLQRLRAAFAQLEGAVDAGTIRVYGIATWNGLRQPESAADHLPLQTLVQLAAEVGGPQHHFRVVQAPFNLQMPEALTRHTQRVDGELVSLLDAAQRLGLTVMASASIRQGHLSRGVPPMLAEVLTGLDTDAQRAIQFVRSAPGLTTALVGMRQERHVEENLATARVAPLAPQQYAQLFRAA